MIEREWMVAGKCLTKSIKRAGSDIPKDNADCARRKLYDSLIARRRTGNRVSSFSFAHYGWTRPLVNAGNPPWMGFFSPRRQSARVITVIACPQWEDKLNADRYRPAISNLRRRQCASESPRKSRITNIESV